MASTGIANIMIPLDEYPHIPYWFTLRQAIAEMENAELERHGKRSLPRVVLVFDERYQFLGVVGRRDILRGLTPDFLKAHVPRDHRRMFDVRVDSDLAALSFDRMLEGIRERSEHRLVSDVMVPVTVTLQTTDNLLQVVSEMVNNHLSIIPVMEGKKVVGVVRSVDAFHEIAKAVL